MNSRQQIYKVKLTGLSDVLTGNREVWRITHRFLSWATLWMVAPVSEMDGPGAW